MIRSVQLNNCLLWNTLTILNQNNIHISYSDNNILPRRWQRLFKQLNVPFEKAIEEPQMYIIASATRLYYSTRENKNLLPGVYKKRYEKNDDYKVGYILSDEEKKKLQISLSINSDNEIGQALVQIQSSNLSSLSLSGTLNGKMAVENCQINSWYIRSFSVLKEAEFYNIRPEKERLSESKIEFHKSNLDRITFSNINFNDYSVVSFHRTKFGKSIFTSCNFPADSISFEKFKTLENIHYPDKVSDNYYKDQYEIFLQLKSILESTGNFYESQKLQAISNEALKKIKSISGWDRFILEANAFSNNHGLSIKRPFLLFLGFSIGFYILYLLSLGRVFNSNPVDYHLIGYYFSFIDLTHRNDFLVDKAEFNGFSLAIDYLSKVVSGYFIYQFVAAFRKYGKH